ncbi:hypothetical protein RHGRI_003669 [Rhododendron griersonianum]|uniref:EF-hand domain-containing protein n=1 Tax=Rhododendron griersonianum TaxID=479676 RepID=A0AAV6L7N1_9ERIC|nr:hypothetical protein RHGRI_003669 [Rhododendron griersonianum]
MFLDKNHNGTLDFEECVTFFYMIASNRLLQCDECRSLLLAAYFLCVECYNANREKTYDLCCSCYSDNNFSHAHSYFLDNYALLLQKEIKNYTSGQAGGSIRSETGKIVDLADNLLNYVSSIGS